MVIRDQPNIIHMATVIKKTFGCILITAGVIGLFLPILPGIVMIGVGTTILKLNRTKAEGDLKELCS